MPPSKSEPQIEYRFEKGKGWVAYLTREINVQWKVKVLRDQYGRRYTAWDDYEDDIPF